MAAGRTALGAYRTLLRAQRQVFGGDAVALEGARAQTRAEFAKYRDESDPERISTLIADALDTAEFMRLHIVQGTLNERGNYAVAIDPAVHAASTSTTPEHVDDISEVAELHEMKAKRKQTTSREGRDSESRPQ